jgi:hypothetical protein
VKARIYTWRAASKRPFSHLGGPDSEPRSPGKGGLVMNPGWEKHYWGNNPKPKVVSV